MKPRNLIVISLTLAAILISCIYARCIFLLAHQPINTDMMLLYLSGKMLNGHTSGYEFSHTYLSVHKSTGHFIANLSPPFSLMITAIGARYASYKNFFLSFTSFAIFIDMLALIMLYRHFFTKKNHPSLLKISASILANFIYIPALMNITFGEVALVLNALVIFSYLLLQRKQFVCASFLLALAINIKLFFALFAVYFLAKQHYRAFFSLILFTLLLATIPLLIYGTPIYIGYWKILNHVQWYGVNWNASWLGFFSRIFGESSHRYHTALYLPLLSRCLYDGVFLFYVACIYYFSKKSADSSLTFSFTLSSMLLISPLGWNYYFPILITALLINLIAAETHRYYILFICLLLLSVFLSALPFPIYYDTKIPAINLVSQGNIYFLALLLFNTVNFLQLLIDSGNRQPLLLTPKFKRFILCVCIFPSVIGMGGIACAFFKDQIPQDKSTALASIEELQPSYHY